MDLSSNLKQDFDMVDQVIRTTLILTIKNEYIQYNTKDLQNINITLLAIYSIKKELNEINTFNDKNLADINSNKNVYLKHAREIKNLILNKNQNIIIDLIKLNLYRYSIFPDIENPVQYLNFFKDKEYGIDSMPTIAEIKSILKKWKKIIKQSEKFNTYI